MKLELIDDARKWWKMLSVQAMVLAGAVQSTWAVFSDDLKQNVPHWLVTTLTLGLLAAGIGGRMVKQPGQPCPPPNNPNVVNTRENNNTPPGSA